MATVIAIVQHSGGNSERLELTVPDTLKVWELSLLLKDKLNTGISAEIATEEKVLVGNARLEPVTEGGIYILAALEIVE